MTIPDTFWQMAGMITVLGMGVVFVALLLLSVYMHFFKSVIARVEGRHREQMAPAPKTPAPSVAPAPKAPPATAALDDEGPRTAAAVAVALRLAGVGGAPAGEVAAAIATALGLHRARSTARLAAAPVTPFSGWQVSGRMASMAARVARQERLGR